MIPPKDHRKGRTDGVPGDLPKVGFTMVEMVVTLFVACILMVAVVAFLINGVVSTQKTTMINDTTTKGRYIFEHLSREMYRAQDITTTANFTTVNPMPPVPANPGYQGFTYTISVGGQAQNGSATVPVTDGVAPPITLVLGPSDPPDYLVPQAGDNLQIPGTNFAGPGNTTPIASVVGPGTPDGSGSWQITLTNPIYVLGGLSATHGDIGPNTIFQITRTRSYSIQTDPTTGDVQLWWYPNTAGMQATYVIAKSLPPVGGLPQYPFYAQPVPIASGGNYFYVGMNLQLNVPLVSPTPFVTPSPLPPGVLAGQASFYSNNTLNAVFVNKSGESPSFAFNPTGTPTPTPTPTHTPIPSPTPTPSPTPSPTPTPSATPSPSPTPAPSPLPTKAP